MKEYRLIFTILFVAVAATVSFACSRVVYAGSKNIVMVGRTLDWRTPIPTNLYVYPRGVEKSSMSGGNCFHWTSRYGSVLAVSYDGGVTEGLNERGLVVNGLFCKGSVYKVAMPEDSIPVMSLAMFVSFFLDNFATVDEVEPWLHSNPFAIYGQAFDGGTVSLLHWGITDITGESLVIEYSDGELKTYRGRDLTVLTNNPQLPQMQAIEDYWSKIGGANALPGTVSSPDRFVRASFFIDHVPLDFDYPEAFAALGSIMGTVSVPFGYEVQGEPNVSSTQWTSVADATGGKYYLKFTDSFGWMWIDMKRLDLNVGAPVLKLDTSDHSDITGYVGGRLVETEGFTPLW